MNILIALLTAVCADDLVIAEGGKSSATIVVSPRAGEEEKRAAADLARILERMTGAKIPVGEAPADGPAFLIGTAALEADPGLKDVLAAAAKKTPVLRAEAIAIRRKGNRVLLAGTDDLSHAFAVTELLRRWGCRWYLPTEFGECIPETSRLVLSDIDYVYAPPFEVRKYWISWNGDNAGEAEFKRRNFFNNESVPNGHALDKYVAELVPKGKSAFNVPISEDKTMDHVASKVMDAFGRGEKIIMGMEDGVYSSDSPRDKMLMAGLRDKYFMSSSLTDAFFEFYNGVSRRLLAKHPQSNSKIGFLAYANLTIPPQRDVVAEKPLVAYLAPIDIDPIHGMDDPRSPPKGEYKAMLYRWAQVMQGRLVIYDYDQGMMVWRDVPNPSHLAFRNDVQHYRKAGILGVDTESRNAIATIFLNLYFRGLLCWNPEADVDAELAAFYPKFYGPAAEPMQRYWTAIYDAWKNTLVTEHEYFALPAIYTRPLVEQLAKPLAEAEKLVASLEGKTRQEKQVLERVKFTRLSYDVLDHCTKMVAAAATEGDYAAAAAEGDQALAAREKLTEMNGTFTTYKRIGEHGPAWFPGEVAQYRNLAALVDGKTGTRVAKLPLEWAFRRDPHDTGLVSGWPAQEADLTWWKSVKDPGSVASHQTNPGHWEMMRTDLYLQAQGLITPDYHSLTGYGWYQTTVSIDDVAKAHVMFPGVFNECWLYVNGFLVGHRPQKEPWWFNDYAFQWDVDLSAALKPGKNTLTLRIYNPHHFGGMFRRPFLYRSN